MEGFDEVINSYQATINTLMVQKARKDDIEMKKREEIEEEMNEGFSKRLKISELIKSYMEWELDATLTDLQIIRQQQEFIKKIIEIVGEYSSNEEKLEEANQMLKEADAAIEHIKKEKSDKFHECARYKALLKDALRLVPKEARKKFIDEKIKVLNNSIHTENPENEIENKEPKNNDFISDDDFSGEQEDELERIKEPKTCHGCGVDISDKKTTGKWCKNCAKKAKNKQTDESHARTKQRLKKSNPLLDSNTNVT